MSKRTEISNVRVSEVLRRKEFLQTKFFKECINKTNQFSAQFVLERMLHEHLNHLKELQQEVLLLEREEVSQTSYLSGEYELFFEKLCSEFDLSTLTLNEAARIAIRLEERDLDFFKIVLENASEDKSKKALRRIISRKTLFIKRLKKERDRIVSKN